MSSADAQTSENVMRELMKIGVGSQIGTITATDIEWRSPKRVDVGTSWVQKNANLYLVLSGIEKEAALTFDYVMMLIVASLIALGGLSTNSSVIVVASMLVSPIMGPVKGLAFDVWFKDGSNALKSVRNEMLSLLVCIITGAIFGFLYEWMTENRNDWPTDEMLSRGNFNALTDGIFIAAVSGIGVATSALGDYVSVVVGVAISASLLPPAVNTGMLLTFPIFKEVFPHYVSDPDEYSTIEFIEMAGISLALTLINIVVIFIAALAWFWVKEKGQKYLDPKVEDSLWHKVSEFKQNHIRRSNDRFLEHIPFVEDIVPSDSVRPTKMAMHRKDLLRDEQQRFAVDGSNMKDELFKNAILQRYSTVRNLELNKDGDGDAKSNGQQDTSLLDNDDVEIVYAGDEDPKSKGQQDPAFKRNNDVEILYTEWTSYNVRIASVDDVSDVMALLLENQDVMKLRSENEVRILIAQKFAVVCTTTNALGEEVIIGYFEDRVLREEQMGESEINKVLLKQTGRTINCREKDLIFYWGGLVGKKNSRGISRAISRFVAEKHSSQVQEAHLKRQRVLFIWCAMKVVHRRSTKIANSFVSGVAGEDAVTHKVSFPTTMRDGSGRNGQMVIVHMDPQLLPLQQKRLSRNVCLITEAEQRRLMNCRIGVIGLSTGSVALEVLLREGIGGQYRIADFDVFEISNSNRMLYGVADEGASKIDLCAQRIASVDPAIQIEKYPKGLNQENVEQFVRGCDLIVEECDNIMVKAMVRVNAQKFKIPLVMGTSQNGMIDVERYDVDSECRPFYLESLPPGLAEGHSLSAEEKTKFLARLFSKDQLSPRFVEAMPQVGVTIPSWPQLAEQVTLNAATVAHSARRILLGDHGLVSGRFAIRMDRLFVPENRLYPSVRD